MAQVYAARYLAKAVADVPRSLANACLSRFTPIYPTVLIFNCTFVCDARCEMCSNWKRGNRQSDMTLDDIERVFSSPFWRRLENINISGGEPTTRNDLVDIVRIILDKLPRLRKLGLNTTGLTPHRAVPMLTDIVKLCDDRDVILSFRVSIDGIGQMHNDVRQVPQGFEKAGETICAMQELQQQYQFNFGISTTIFSLNMDDAENVLRWARRQDLDIVFNMVRFTDPMLGNGALADTCRPIGKDEERMQQFFRDRIRTDPLLDGQSYIYMHYADMIANGYHRLAPCPFQTQGVMLNPDGGLFFCENSELVGNVRDEDPSEIYFRKSSRTHLEHVKQVQCPTCVSPCQMNVSAIKQIVPYVKFLVRALIERRKSKR